MTLPWRGTTPEISSEADSRYETPGGAQNKVNVSQEYLLHLLKLAVTGLSDGSEAAIARYSTPYDITYDWLKDRLDAADQREINRKEYNVRNFGAKGDYNHLTGMGTDDTQSFKDAYNVAKLTNGVVIIPQGNYLVDSSQINVDAMVKFKGERIFDKGSVLYVKSNHPVFYVTSASSFEGISIIGSDNIAHSLQDGIFVDGVSNVDIIGCFFDNLYNSIHVKDAVFYSTIERCRFFSAKNSFIYGEGAHPSGYQITINKCIASAADSKYGFYFENVGTLTILDLEMSPTGCTDSSIRFESLATNAGVQQISHSRIEGSLSYGIKLTGTESNPIQYVSVSNSYIAGNQSVFGEYCRNISFDNCYFTGEDDGGEDRNGFSSLYQADNISFNNCEFQVTNAPLRVADTCTSVSFNVTNPNYPGTLPFIYLPYLDPLRIKRVSVFGGYIGSNARPIDLPGLSYSPTVTRVDVANVYVTSRNEVSVQSATATKVYIIPHGLPATPSYVNVISGSPDVATARIAMVARDDTNITVTLENNPTVGTNNLVFFYEAKM